MQKICTAKRRATSSVRCIHFGVLAQYPEERPQRLHGPLDFLRRQADVIQLTPRTTINSFPRSSITDSSPNSRSCGWMASRHADVVLSAPLLYRVADDGDEDEFVAAFVLTEFADDAVVVPFALLIARVADHRGAATVLQPGFLAFADEPVLRGFVVGRVLNGLGYFANFTEVVLRRTWDFA